MFFSNWIVSDKEEKEYFDWNGDMNTMIHDIMYRMNDKYIWNNIKSTKTFKTWFNAYKKDLPVFKYVFFWT